MGTHFEEYLKIGRVGEDLISKWLMRRGWSILPVYEISLETGKGPRVYCASGDLIAPDSLAFKDGKIMWVEAKFKSGFSLHRITGHYVTGIDLKHYEHYLEVSRRSKYPLWLMFLHRGHYAKDSFDNETGLFAQEIRKLEKTEHHRSDKWGKHGMVYWAKESLIKIAELDEVLSSGVSSF